MTAPAPRPADDRARLRLWLAMLRTTRAIEGELRRRMDAAFATTLPRFDVMASLDRVPDGLTMSALSRALLVSNGNSTGIVERLVLDGLVERRERDGDRRATIVRLTPTGREAFAAMAAAHALWIDELMDGLDPEDARAVAATLAAAKPMESDA